MTRTQLQIFLVIDCGIIAMGGISCALDPEGSVAMGVAVVAAMATQAIVALRREQVRQGGGVTSEPTDERGHSSF